MQKEQSKNTETIWTILNATSECPHHTCDGTGISWSMNNKTLETRAQYCKCRNETVRNKRLSFANIPEEFSELTIKSFDSRVYTSKTDRALAATSKKITANYIRNFEKFKDTGKGLYYYSETRGSGKTRLAVSLGNVLLNNKIQEVRFITTLDLLREIRNTYNTESKYTESQLIEGITSTEILILDDIGVERPTDWVNEILFNIFDTRVKYKKITICTSNCSIESLEHDKRLISRLYKMCIPVKMPEEDIRKMQSKEENRELQDLLLRD